MVLTLIVGKVLASASDIYLSAVGRNDVIVVQARLDVPDVGQTCGAATSMASFVPCRQVDDAVDRCRLGTGAAAFPDCID